ncbi:MAG: 2-oxoacid:acceptor oxidoreductase family protein [Candidatus Thorarchaeota archaeon]|jgi:2-oxoglutarate ferredoxin oxidoreductase subunit gamma
MKTEIRIAGTGGMGVVLAGVILGHAAVVYGGLEAVQSQSYGSEARGTSAKSEVIVSDQPIKYPKVRIKYPKVRESDYFVVMSQKALEMYLAGAKKNSVLIVDPDLVNTKDIKDYEIIEVPAMKTADELGLRLVSNMVMLGALVKKTGLFPLETLEKAAADLISAKALEIDIKAIRAGAELV